MGKKNRSVQTLTGHLAYYRAHGILPVAYTGTQEQHFQRRASLYRSLRLPPIAFRGARVLEVAAGTGQNAEYISHQYPATLDLVEPSPSESLNGPPGMWPRVPYIHEKTLQEFNTTERWDIVICENWLGVLELEAGLLDKLASFVAPGGVLVLTCIHPTGIYPNLLRRKIAARLVNDSMSFESKTQILVSAFETHLATMPDMTRSARDWVQDMLLNPAVEHVGLTFPMLVECLGSEFTILGTSPEFIVDWRWFKSLYGDARRFNNRALVEYYGAEKRFADQADSFDPQRGIAEAQALLARDVISIGDVRAMGPFRSLFGRETLYVSWERAA
jgi:2-polyprenyl-3-methyl-5-hydroxy-6-metoxy-1,4-benzoquinol methylase